MMTSIHKETRRVPLIITILVIIIIIIISIIITIIILITIYYLLYHSLCWCLFIDQPGAYHASGASDTQVIHSDHTLSTFLRIRADRSILIFWVSVTEALSDTLSMFSTIPFLIVPSAPTTTGITSVCICHILCISNSRSLELLFFFSISFRAIFLSDGIDISISLQVEFTESLMIISGLFAVIVLSVWHVPHDGDFPVFVVHHRLWLVLVPIVDNLHIIILTDVPVEILLILERCNLL